MKKILAILIAVIGVFCLLFALVNGTITLIEISRFGGREMSSLVRVILYFARDSVVGIAMILTGIALLSPSASNSR